MKKFSYVSILLILALSFTGCSFIKKDQSKEDIIPAQAIISHQSSEKDLGQIESIIEYGDHSVIGAHFPILGIDNIDRMNKGIVLSEIDNFKSLVKNYSTEDENYKSELSIDYKTYEFSPTILSIKFIVSENLTYYDQANISIITKTYDLKNKKLIELADILDQNYLGPLSKYIVDFFHNSEKYKDFTDTDLFTEALRPNFHNFNNFILEEDQIVFFFQKHELFPASLGIPRVEIPYDDLDRYFNSYFLDEMPIAIVSSRDNSDLVQEEESNIVVCNISREIDPYQPMVALTFDDGPNKSTTTPILDTLKEYNGAGTFFILGNRVQGNEDILIRMIQEGSEIGNHSFNHKQLTTISSSEVEDQINKTQDAVMEVIGRKPKLMRPTYGSYDDNLKSQIDMPMILWSIDTMDWKSKNAEKISNHVLTNIKDGDIVLMHDIYGSTADAIKTIVPELVNRGYQLVTVSELYELRNETLQVGNIYNRSYKE